MVCGTCSRPSTSSSGNPAASTIVVYMSDAKVSADANAVLATYSLGSCIAVALYDPIAHIGGLLHFQLPSSTLDPQRAKQNPAMFADSGMDNLLKQLTALGAQAKRLKVKLAGAAQILDDGGMFNIGRRNHAAIRKLLWQHGLFIDGEDIGGNRPRNVYLNVASGEVTSKSEETTLAL
jgi:chemotaxis protein CheD